ncbi:hypothetical protein IU408_27845, partial [Nocardia cyriacigeorgica]|nr:hypothetical protein [Nocardia cyriacigeorgica]
MATTTTPATQDTADSEQPQGPEKRRGWLRLEFGGLVGALVLIWLSLTPSLLPRDALFQGVVTGAG